MKRLRVWVLVGCLGLLSACNSSTPFTAATTTTATATTTTTPKPVPAAEFYTVDAKNTIYALDALTGVKHWTYHSSGKPFDTSRSIVYGKGILYIPLSGEFWALIPAAILAVSTSTHKPLWTIPLDEPEVATLALVNDVLYVGSFDNNNQAGGALYAVDGATGNRLWKTTLGNIANSAAVVADNTVFLGDSYKPTFYALNASDGTIKWKFATGSANLSTAVVQQGVVYFASDDKHIYALDEATGTFQWKFATDGAIDTQLIIANNTLYASGNILYALNPSSGQLIWHLTISQYGGPSPSFANDLLYVGSSGTNSLLAIDAVTGVLRWEYKTAPAFIDSKPTAYGNTVYITTQYNVIALSMDGATVRWKMALNQPSNAIVIPDSGL